MRNQGIGLLFRVVLRQRRKEDMLGVERLADVLRGRAERVVACKRDDDRTANAQMRLCGIRTVAGFRQISHQSPCNSISILSPSHKILSIIIFNLSRCSNTDKLSNAVMIVNNVFFISRVACISSA